MDGYDFVYQITVARKIRRLTVAVIVFGALISLHIVGDWIAFLYSIWGRK